MIEQPDPHHFAGLRHPPREGEVLGARRRVTRRMGVKEQQRRCAAQETLLEHRTWLDRRPSERAAKELGLADQAMATVEEERAHDLLVAAAVAQAEVARHHRRLSQRILERQLGAGDPASDLDRGQDRRRHRGAQAATPQPLGIGARQTHQAAAPVEHAARQLDRGGAPAPGAQQDRYQLGIGHAARAPRQQSFTRPLVAGYVRE